MKEIVATQAMAVVNPQLPDTNMTYNIHRAAPHEWEQVRSLLATNKLPSEDLSGDACTVFAATEGNKVIGAIGLEQYNQAGLLRSMVTDPDYRNQGIATQLVDAVFAAANREGITEMYLLTETAEHYFARKGFTAVSRDVAPEALRSSTEFSHVCPASAVFMKKEVS